MASLDRLRSLDLTRGLIVAIMALDHTRMFFSNANFEPTDLTQTTVAYFFTRVITHLCAPGFFFVAGVGAALYLDSIVSPAKLRTFLATRGVWLILMEIVWLGVSWSLHPGWWWFGVLWSLGCGFILLAALCGLPRALVLAIGGALAVLLPLAAGVHFARGSVEAQVWTLLCGGGVVRLPLVGPRIVLFPVIPWFALMAIGFGSANHLFGANRFRRLLVTGLVLLAAFVVLRLGHFYGEPSREASSVWPALEFFNVEKYPPSLHFDLLTIGTLLVVCAGFERIGNGLQSLFAPLQAYGRAPFAFYVIHIPLIHLLALATALILAWPTAYLFWSGFVPNLTPPAGYGLPLPGVYAAWLFVLLLLYPLCLGVAALKRAKSWWWLRYV